MNSLGLIQTWASKWR